LTEISDVRELPRSLCLSYQLTTPQFCDDIFSRFDTTQACDRRRDRHRAVAYTYRAVHMRCIYGKIYDLNLNMIDTENVIRSRRKVCQRKHLIIIHTRDGDTNPQQDLTVPNYPEPVPDTGCFSGRSRIWQGSSSGSSPGNQSPPLELKGQSKALTPVEVTRLCDDIKYMILGRHSVLNFP